MSLLAINSRIKKFFQGDQRTVQLKKNIIGSILLKGVSIFISFEIVPLTIDFINPVQYGIWITLSSLMSWFTFFDIGLTLGFRNKFAEAKAKGKFKLAKIYVSTTYASLFILFGTFLLIFLPVNHFIDWSSILNISPDYKQELDVVFGIMVFFFCMTMIFQVLTTMLTADQKPALTSLLNVIGQALACIAIFILTKCVKDGSLIILAFVYSGIPVIVVFISTFFFFFYKYRMVAPSFKFIKFKYVKNIMGMGGKFFIISTAMLFIFQLINIIISRNLGPETVTKYNIAYKYFSMAYMFTVLVINPFWSAFTDAYTRGNIDWMKKMVHKLEVAWLIALPILILMLICSPIFYRFWIKDVVNIPFIMNLSLMIYISFLMIANIYMYLINGIGKVQLQLYIYIFFSFISYPIMNYLCKKYEIPGLLIIPIIVYILQALAGRIQIYKLLNGKAYGIWNK